MTRFAPPYPPSQLAVDIQAVLTVLGRRTYTYGYGEKQPLNLEKTALRGANLKGAQLQGANLEGAQMQGANLSEAQLQGANLWKAALQGADLWRAQLQGATGLTLEQLSTVKTLYQAHIDLPLLEQIQQRYALLLEAPW
jgi:hypothetical protein